MRNNRVGLNVKKVLPGLLLALWLGAPVGAAHAEEQLLENRYFAAPALEAGQRNVMPEDWMTFSSDNQVQIHLTRDRAKEGEQSVRFAASGTANTFQGMSQVAAVEAGSSYEFAVHVYLAREEEDRGSLRGQLSVEWLNAQDEEVARSWGPVWTDEDSPGFWQEFSLTAEAPEGAVNGRFVITQFDTGDAERPGIFHVDDAGVWELP